MMQAVIAILFLLGFSQATEPIGYLAPMCSLFAIWEYFEGDLDTRSKFRLSVLNLYSIIVASLVCPFASNDLILILNGSNLRDARPEWYWLTVVTFAACWTATTACFVALRRIRD